MPRTWIGGCCLAVVSLTFAALLGPGDVGATPATSTWSIATSDNNGTDSNALEATACATPQLCWAVGDYYSDTVGEDQTLVEQSDGAAGGDGNVWTAVASGDAISAGGDGEWNLLGGVACASATLCWAVGDSQYGPSAPQTLVLRWDGTADSSGDLWSVVASADQGTDGNRLYGVACASATLCWAVGTYYSDDAGTAQTLIEQWDGSTDPSGDLWTVVSSDDVTAAGVASAATPADYNELDGVACASSTLCWAVGYYKGADTSEDAQTLAEEWDGGDAASGNLWGAVTSDDMTGPGLEWNQLSGVTCATAASCWAVGNFDDSNSTAQALVEGWDGAAAGSGNLWGAVQSADLSDPNNGNEEMNQLTGVACSAATQCWAVGDYTDASDVDSDPDATPWDQTLVEQLDGGAWDAVLAPDVEATGGAEEDNELAGVTCAAAAECWAVGSYGYGDPTLVMQEGSVPPAPTASAAPIPVPNTGAPAGSPWPSGTVALLLGVLLVGTAVAWRRGWGQAASADRSEMEI